jgi:hypothetical protein
MIEEKGEIIRSGYSTVLMDATSNDHLLLKFETQLRVEILHTENKLDDKMKQIVKGKGREKWSLQYQMQWEMNKKDQARNWAFRLKTSFVLLFNYEHHVEDYKKKMRKEIHNLFNNSSTNSSYFNWTADVKKDQKFEELYSNMLKDVRQQFPSKDVSAEIVKVYQNSNVIRNRMIDMKLSEDDSSLLLKLQQQPIYFFRKNPNAVEKCLKSVDTIVNSIAASQQCYDDIITTHFIYDVDASITLHKVSTNSEVQKIHMYGQDRISGVMEKIGRDWETENSVFAKLERNKEAMREYFIMVSEGVEKTKLFAVNLANSLKSVLMPGNYEHQSFRFYDNSVTLTLIKHSKFY